MFTRQHIVSPMSRESIARSKEGKLRQSTGQLDSGRRATQVKIVDDRAADLSMKNAAFYQKATTQVVQRVAKTPAANQSRLQKV